MDSEKRILSSHDLTQEEAAFARSYHNYTRRAITLSNFWENYGRQDLENRIFNNLQPISKIPDILYPDTSLPFLYSEWESNYLKLRRIMTPAQLEDVYFKTCDRLVDFIRNVLKY